MRQAITRQTLDEDVEFLRRQHPFPLVPSQAFGCAPICWGRSRSCRLFDGHSQDWGAVWLRNTAEMQALFSWTGWHHHQEGGLRCEGLSWRKNMEKHISTHLQVSSGVYCQDDNLNSAFIAGEAGEEGRGEGGSWNHWSFSWAFSFQSRLHGLPGHQSWWSQRWGSQRRRCQARRRNGWSH